MATAVEPTHSFHAQAEILSGQLQHPLNQTIQPQAYVKLPEEGGYRSERAENYRLEGVLSFKSAYTQVAGNRSLKGDGDKGWVTLVTSVVEGLNILDVITADRVVGQASTHHPFKGHVPAITFLGTRFENLKINGHHVNPVLDLEICGPPPTGDKPYFEDPAFLGRVQKQRTAISGSKNLPDWARQKYDWSSSAAQKQGEVECSLVSSVVHPGMGTSFGNVFVVPDFGKIFLAELTLNRENKNEPHSYAFNLTMIRIELGCIAHGTTRSVNLSANGVTKP
jgi:hypothetical protein